MPNFSSVKLTSRSEATRELPWDEPLNFKPLSDAADNTFLTFLATPAGRLLTFDGFNEVCMNGGSSVQSVLEVENLPPHYCGSVRISKTRI
ncbi:hypothetical protein AVEN_144661-1 [Araneus ventricosus]|uniref:Uncharacterized protein n=1 Tax=Araneus ventricosus TaxID=182803 RepID=A0A4Y2DZI7_ARAVE|nr:hypothetical protein AVEN_144661-1 [Araneus ventricosus]